MKKRMVSLLLCIALCLVLLPTTASAADRYGVWISGVEIDSDNMTNVLSDGKVFYDPSTSTLTILEGANITKTYSGGLIYTYKSELTINAPQGFTLINSSADYGIIMSGSNVKLTINGDTNISTRSSCLDLPGSVTINGDVTLNSASSNGCYASGGVTIDGSLNVNASAYGLRVNNGSVSISKDVTIKSSYQCIYAPLGTVSIQSGTWTLDGTGSIAAKSISMPDHEITEPVGGMVGTLNGNATIVNADGTAANHVVISPKGSIPGKTNLDGTALVSGKFYAVSDSGLAAVDKPLDTAPSSGKYILYTEADDKGTIEAFGGDVTIDSVTGNPTIETALAALDVINNSGALTLTTAASEHLNVVAGNTADLTFRAKTTLTVQCLKANTDTYSSSIVLGSNVTLIAPDGINIDSAKGTAPYALATLTMTASNGTITTNGWIYATDFDIEAKGDVNLGYIVSTTGKTGKIVSQTGDVNLTGTNYCLYNGATIDFTVTAAKKINIRSTEKSIGVTYSILAAKSMTLIAPDGITVNSADGAGPYTSSGKLTMTSTGGGIDVRGFFIMKDCDINARGDINLDGYLWLSSANGAAAITSQQGSISINSETVYCLSQTDGAKGYTFSAKRITMVGKYDTGAVVAAPVKLTADEIAVLNTGSGKAFAAAPDLSGIASYDMYAGATTPGERVIGPRDTDFTENAYVYVVAKHTCPGAAFTDMPKFTNWAHEGIDYVISHGLMTGTSATTFAPKTPMSRAMLVTVLYRMEGEPGAGSSTFTDVKPTAWYGAAVSWAADHGVVTGKGENKFDPNGNVTREQIATILFRYATYKGYDTTKQDNLLSFSDTTSVGKWFVDGMKWAVAEGLINGSVVGGKALLTPQGDATREQVAAILMRFCQNVAK